MIFILEHTKDEMSVLHIRTAHLNMQVKKIKKHMEENLPTKRKIKFKCDIYLILLCSEFEE